MRRSTVPRLTPAERLVMEYYVGGMSRERIATEMVLSCHTVAMHLRNVKLKLGAQNMAQAGKRYGDIVRGDHSETIEARSQLAPPNTVMSEKDYHKW